MPVTLTYPANTELDKARMVAFVTGWRLAYALLWLRKGCPVRPDGYGSAPADFYPSHQELVDVIAELEKIGVDG